MSSEMEDEGSSRPNIQDSRVKLNCSGESRAKGEAEKGSRWNKQVEYPVPLVIRTVGGHRRIL